MIAGVCGGVAEYLNMDPTMVRIAWILLSILPLIPGILLYIIAWFVIPKRPLNETGARATGPAAPVSAFLGVLFIAIGALVFLGNLDILDWEEWWEFSWEFVLPLLLIAVGVFFIARPSPKPEAPSAEVPTAEPVTGQMRRLFRSRRDKKVGGVCGGLGSYFGIDPSMIRIAFVFFTIWPFGLGAVVYLIMMLLVPEEQPTPVVQS
jgi:phage shock protein C